MALLYRGVCDEVDQQNAGELQPKGKHHEVSIRRDGKIKKRDGKFSRFPSENNAVRAHQIESGLYGECFISFTRSEDVARRFAVRNPDGERTAGSLYVVDEALLAQYGVVACEVPDPEYPSEMEVTLRAKDNQNLPTEIVVEKRRVYAKTMDKALLRGKLQTIKNNFALVQAGIGLMAAPDTLERLDKVFAQVKHHPEANSVQYIRYVFETDDLLKHATNELRNSVLRNCLKETFELVKLYGDQTNQAIVVKAAPWYQFLRIVRNCLSHDLQMRFRESDLKRLPVTWAGLTLDRSMHNGPLQMRDFLSR